MVPVSIACMDSGAEEVIFRLKHREGSPGVAYQYGFLGRSITPVLESSCDPDLEGFDLPRAGGFYVAKIVRECEVDEPEGLRVAGDEACLTFEGRSLVGAALSASQRWMWVLSASGPHRRAGRSLFGSGDAHDLCATAYGQHHVQLVDMDSRAIVGRSIIRSVSKAETDVGFKVAWLGDKGIVVLSLSSRTIGWQ